MEDESSESVIKIGQGVPYIRKRNRNAPRKPLPFGRRDEEMETEEFEREISDLKKEIQQMKALGETDSSEEEDEETVKDQETSDLIKKIKSFRDEIKLEQGLPIESSEEFDDENTDDDIDDESSEEFEGESFEDDMDHIIEDEADDIIEDEAENDESSSEVVEGIKNVKLTQTFDGQDEESESLLSSVQDEDEVENTETIDELVKVIQVLKDQIIDQREKEAEAFIQGLVNDEMFDSEESVDEKLLAIFKNLEVNEDLKDIKHFNDENDGEKKPFVKIEQPANLNSGEVKIGFVVSNEEEDSKEEHKIDLIQDDSAIPQRVAEIEIVPIFVELQPIEFPENNVVEMVEIVKIPDNDVLKADEIYTVEKKSEIAKKNVPENIMSGGIISKVGSIFDFVKKHFS